jgi:hypothetical protein
MMTHCGCTHRCGRSQRVYARHVARVHGFTASYEHGLVDPAKVGDLEKHANKYPISEAKQHHRDRQRDVPVKTVVRFRSKVAC